MKCLKGIIGGALMAVAFCGGFTPCLVGRAVAAPLVVVSLRGGLAPLRSGWRLRQLSRRRRLLRCGWRLWQLISDFAAGCSPFDLD